MRRKSVSWTSILILLTGSIAAARQMSRIAGEAEPPSTRTGLSVEEAYRAIPHRRTEFRFDRSPIPSPERDYLSTMFDLIDRGVVLRVSALRSFTEGGPDRDSLLADISRLADLVENEITPPESLRDYHAEVVTALKNQRELFTQWRREGESFQYGDGQRLGQSPLVQASSRALRAAYGILMKRYGSREDRENQNAFFDYHCALDFL